ncbi:MAG TPA: DUF4245 family protein [Microbacteriaceae bacterium]|nr:DUF4245 family protein [Microbacteriaceae bacterium]
MSRTPKAPAIVAELGRPETPEEAALRREAATRERRSRRTIGNLIVSLLAVAAAVVVVAMMTPTPKMTAAPRADFRSIAKQVSGAESTALVVPDLDSSWRCNVARLNTNTPDGIDYWQLGFVTPSDGFVTIEQGFDANPTWAANQLSPAAAAGHRTIDGITWNLFDNHTSAGSAVRYGLTVTYGKNAYAVFGSASLAEVEHVAGSISGQITATRLRSAPTR